MAELFVVNPAKRIKRKSNPSPAQKRARAAFAKMAKAKSKERKTMATAKRRKANPARRKTRARARAANPVKVRRVYARKANPARRVHRRRNPIGLNSTAGKPLSLLTPAFVGALGAVGVNTVYANIASMLPTTLTTGYPIYLTRAALSLGLAALANHAGSKRAAVLQAAEGSLTVTLHDAIVAMSAGFGMSLNGMGAYVPGRLPRGGAQGGQRMGAHLGAHLGNARQPQLTMAQVRAATAPRQAKRGMSMR
jgi:hypothetical protein